MYVLITGGAGFIGSHLARRLLARGDDVLIVDDLSTGHRDNVPPEAELLELDLSDPGSLRSLPSERPHVVCHLAAQSSGPASADAPLHDFRCNALSTLLLARWCLERGVPRFVYASSMAVYGDRNGGAVDESAACTPLSYYGASKLAAEGLLGVAAREGLRVTSLRMFSVYGPGQNLANRRQGMVSIYLAYLLDGVEVPVTGSLSRIRDFVYIDDALDAWIATLDMAETPRSIYNIGTGVATSVRELLDRLIRELGLPEGHPIKELEGQVSDQQGMAADIAAARRELGWEPRVDLADGLGRMATWAKSLPG